MKNKLILISVMFLMLPVIAADSKIDMSQLHDIQVVGTMHAYYADMIVSKRTKDSFSGDVADLMICNNEVGEKKPAQCTLLKFKGGLVTGFKVPNPYYD